MARLFLSLFLLGLVLLTAGCQGFFDDYGYQPLQSNISSNS